MTAGWYYSTIGYIGPGAGTKASTAVNATKSNASWVKPGAKLSLQSPQHRSEHWVVVTGTMEVTRGNDVEMLSENQSTYIAVGERHRLANPGKIPAFLIEVQSGAYLGEDDIVRFDDIYRRVETE